MGSAPPQQNQPEERKESPVGILKVTVLGVQINDQEKRTNESIKVRVSNQHFSTDHLSPVGTENVGGDCFTFIINSFYKAQGRIIEVGYFSEDSLVSFGAVDANPILEGKGAENFRVILNHDKQSMHGFVLLRVAFTAMPVHDLTFRIQEAIIRRKTGHFGKDNVAVRLTIGQQIRQTEFRKDSPKEPAIWNDTKYSFKVPHGMHKGLIELISDKGRIVGSADLIVSDFFDMQKDDEFLHSQTLYFTEEQKQITAADLKFSCILGEHADFKERSTEAYSSAFRGSRRNNDISQSRGDERPLSK